MRLVLASTSPARLAVLRAAGIEPLLVAPGVDEEAAVAAASASGPLDAPTMVALLARLKAEAGAERLMSISSPLSIELPISDGFGPRNPTEMGNSIGGEGGLLVFGGDSAFELEGRIHGKPHEPEVARRRWDEQRGRTGVLHSGHHVIRMREGRVIGAAAEVSAATVTFAADLEDAELDAYVASGEPLEVAGAFTIEGRAAAFIDRIEGDPSTVTGLSVPTLRRLVRRLGVAWTDLWA